MSMLEALWPSDSDVRLVAQGLWSTRFEADSGATLLEQPHRSGPYAARGTCSILQHLFTCMPTGFFTPDPHKLATEGVFWFALPQGYRAVVQGSVVPNTQLTCAACRLAALHADQHAAAKAAQLRFRPPMISLFERIAAEECARTLLAALTPLQARLERATQILRAAPRVAAHGRWSLGAMIQADDGKLLLLTGPDLCHVPAEWDLGYLCGELLECMAVAVLEGDRDQLRSLVTTALAIIDAYVEVRPLNVSNVLDMAAARIVAHLAANQELRRRDGLPLVVESEARAFLCAAARCLDVVMLSGIR